MQGSIGCGTRRGVILLLGSAKTGSVSVGRHHCRAIPSGATAVADGASDAEFDDEASHWRQNIHGRLDDGRLDIASR